MTGQVHGESRKSKADEGRTELSGCPPKKTRRFRRLVRLSGPRMLSVRRSALGLELGVYWWEIPTVNDTLLREKNQVTLPTEIVEAAGLTPTKDRIDWRF